MLRAMGMVLHAGGGGQAEGRRTTAVTAEHPGSSTSNGEWGKSSSRTMAEGVGGVGEGRQAGAEEGVAWAAAGVGGLSRRAPLRHNEGGGKRAGGRPAVEGGSGHGSAVERRGSERVGREGQAGGCRTGGGPLEEEEVEMRTSWWEDQQSSQREAVCVVEAG